MARHGVERKSDGFVHRVTPNSIRFQVARRQEYVWSRDDEQGSAVQLRNPSNEAQTLVSARLHVCEAVSL